MHLAKLIKMQKTLDGRIRKEKGLEGKDLVPNTFVALQVELAEFANEGRWFKHWKEDRAPRTSGKCSNCQGKGEGFFSGNRYTGNKEVCVACDGTGINEKENPLLEEFVDGVHFFLSIAIQNGWDDALYIYEEQLDPGDFTGDLTGYYLEMTCFLSNAYIKIYSSEEIEKSKKLYGFPSNQFDFRMAWLCFLNLGINGFGFTLDQIEQAYFDKNKVNHERQANGY
ncbi:dimeric dUTPase (all-alpha-NTP-PPase superfamily) [Lederbergia galactosidilyticus]|uniref:dUTP diphosphatase n=1 Tax=Lederbergia galactosidilytica TaxID=217031 RepID=UPI001AE14C11|nr:dUTP diphosphatase [Lederbergia galactosidilytica]MBP1917209.1 dimeric dUTPase (all-alpha-NTP-PPase superfamily) [Lederbergia galactosidilytica]